MLLEYIDFKSLVLKYKLFFVVFVFYFITYLIRFKAVFRKFKNGSKFIICEKGKVIFTIFATGCAT